MVSRDRLLEILSELSRMAREMPLLVLAVISLVLSSKALKYCLTGVGEHPPSSQERVK